ncbi:MAG TPA: LysM peptidoglycan-binding domain-containing protein [Nakamurella sp.]
MRSQILDDDVDERSWRLPEVDPTGWLVGRPGPSPVRRAIDPAGPAEAAVPGPVRRRRPRRTEAARVARERDLARRRRRRHGRADVADRRAVGAVSVGAVSVGGAGRSVSAVGRVVEPGTRAAGAEPGYRMGRWGRLALTLLVAATLALVVGRVVAGSIAGVAEPELVDVTVRPGDTLWSIASSASPDRDPRAVIDDIRDLNEISGDVVRVGEVLRVPVVSG